MGDCIKAYQKQYNRLPPRPGQKAIADYLDKACTRIDRIIAIKEEQLRKIEAQEKSKAFEIQHREFPE